MATQSPRAGCGIQNLPERRAICELYANYDMASALEPIGTTYKKRLQDILRIVVLDNDKRLGAKKFTVREHCNLIVQFIVASIYFTYLLIWAAIFLDKY